MFHGSYVAIVTPFKNGQVDYDSFKSLIDFQIQNGTQGIVPCGTTGESATLTLEEHEEVVRFVIETVAKRVPVIAGSGSNNTAEALRLTQSAQKMGADGALLISPYYNKPTQKGLYEHYKYISENVSIPLVLYNVPGRTSSNISAATTVALSKMKNIVGIKEASGNLVQISEILRDANPDFLVLSGEDALTYPMLALGCQGVISVTANVAPALVSGMVQLALEGNLAEASKKHLELLELSNILFLETNPIPTKESLAFMNIITPEMRLPLVNMGEENKQKLKEVLKSYALI